ncbi:MAG TPA: hypothetical protein VHE34_05695 [Puia sp.]|uniref:hypothetical protein n=1 Tax=Puia sp. TaxID=2045100 RepID=UPI002B87E75E|nr:hypothetical protein [Puia sp.]HVU94694.1 hypothetical protein [Puia sp.]
MSKLIILAIFLFPASTTLRPPKVVKLDWTTLQNIEFQEKYVEEIKAYMKFPKFSWELKNLGGTVVEIEGYTIPFDKNGLKIALSANPYASCYFCGKAGPASVLTVSLKARNTHYHIDDYKTFRGKLRLNSDDIHEFYYILEESEDVTP